VSRLEVQGLEAGYDDDVVVTDLDLTVEDGTVSAILGPSGCGKTTLLRCIAGFLKPRSGTITLNGRVLVGPDHQVPPERRGIGVVPQEGALFPHLDVGRNISFGLPRGKESQRRVDELLELIGMPDAARLVPSELSGGMQQRVALARALAPTPGLVLLDEPFSALDAGLRSSLRDDVRRLLTLTGTTAVLVTHDQEEALSFADQVAVMRAGRIVQSAAPDELYLRPADLEVARFVGRLLELPGSAQHGRVTTSLGVLVLTDASITGDVVVAIRPEQVELTTEAGGAGVVESITFFGHDHLIETRLADGSTVRSRRTGPPTHRQGDAVSVLINGPVAAFPTT
jgi:iron(III) transport system ATP-binding protein